MKYTTIHIQGNLISEEILQKVANAEAQGQSAAAFGLPPGSSLRNEIEYAWSRIQLEWKQFSRKLQALPPSDPYATTLTRRWMEPFFSSLGFELNREKTALIGSNQQTYPISHTAENADGLPIHIVGCMAPQHPEKNTLDLKGMGGNARFSAHATMQEYLNVSEHPYGLLTNGLYLRLMRDSGRLIKLTYIEFDLRRLLEEDRYSEFTLLYRLLHISRFPRTRAEAQEALLEKYYHDSIETGNRIRNGLSAAVKESLLALGNGFLRHESNEQLRQDILAGKLSPKAFYQQLLRVIYRLLFLMVTEERDLVYEPDDKSDQLRRLKKIYLKYYSLSRLRKLSQSRYVYEQQFTDLWQGLIQTFRLFQDGGQGTRLGIQPLDGELFGPEAIPQLEHCLISNSLLLECIRNMNEFEDEHKNLVSINYRSLDVEELGSVYEGLLELHPIVQHIGADNPAHVDFFFHEGTDRKTTGSYYTRPELVNELIKSALIPVIEQRLREHPHSREAQEKALLSLKICDPAAGSGHMLLAAARTVAWYLARVRTGEENPAPATYRQCLRESIQHCIYAVDFNPDAVELCKLALWLEGHNSGKPISFLDHKIRHGNSLVGVTDMAVLQKGIPDGAFEPVTADDKNTARELKKKNAYFLKTRQTSLFFDPAPAARNHALAGQFAEVANTRQDDVAGRKKAKARFEQYRSNPQRHQEYTACNLWTAAFFWNYTPDEKNIVPDSEHLASFLKNPSAVYGPMAGKAAALSSELTFFHWPLEFPDVFEQGGFDVMLGNPPWERIKLQQQEFFATRSPAVANAPNAAARNRLIAALANTDPALYQEYQHAMHTADCTGKFLRESGRCQLTAVGDINTYSIFAELAASLVNKKGRTGIIVPTGIATDDSNKAFFGAMVESNRLASLFDFENREKIFQDVDSRYKFCLLTLAASSIGSEKARFAFFLTRTEQLQDERRVFGLTREDFLRLNPNTKTCPVFRTRTDAELTTKIYRRVPVLINESTGENPWGVKFSTMFHMSNDSHLFRTKEQLEAEGFSLWGNQMRRGPERWLPLYEAKMIWHYDHRFGSYAGVDSRTSTQTPTPTTEQYQDPNYQALPWYWVSEAEVRKITQDRWFIGFRDITNNTNERTAILSVVPFGGVSNKMPVLQFDNVSSLHRLLLLSNLSAIIFDFIPRQKIGGTSMNFFYVKQFAVLPEKFYRKEEQCKIVPKALELTYTSWDIKGFADDVWREADEELRSGLRAQWAANREATGGHEWLPPEWCEIEEGGCPLPPFRWDEGRRAVLKAELDALYAHLYGLSTEELRYILDPQDVYGPDFPGETFRVLKEKELRHYGEYRTRRLVLEAWERVKSEK